MHLKSPSPFTDPDNQLCLQVVDKSKDLSHLIENERERLRLQKTKKKEDQHLQDLISGTNTPKSTHAKLSEAKAFPSKYDHGGILGDLQIKIDEFVQQLAFEIIGIDIAKRSNSAKISHSKSRLSPSERHRPQPRTSAHKKTHSTAHSYTHSCTHPNHNAYTQGTEITCECRMYCCAWMQHRRPRTMCQVLVAALGDHGSMNVHHQSHPARRRRQ